MKRGSDNSTRQTTRMISTVIIIKIIKNNDAILMIITTIIAIRIKSILILIPILLKSLI